MKYTIAPLALCLVLSGTPTRAEEELTPDYVKDNYPLVQRAQCTDNVTKHEGMCYVFAIGDGNVFMVFTQDGKPVFMRRTKTEGGYDTVWESEELSGQLL